MIVYVVFMPAYNTKDLQIWSSEFLSPPASGVPRDSGRSVREFGSSGAPCLIWLLRYRFCPVGLGIPDRIDARCLPGKLSNYDHVSAWRHERSDLIVGSGGNTFHAAILYALQRPFRKASVFFRRKSRTISGYHTGTTLVPAGDANDGFG